jgi:acylphosphatase
MGETVPPGPLRTSRVSPPKVLVRAPIGPPSGCSTVTVMPTVRRRLIVSGRVQGVFFRDAAKAQADLLRIRGWAKNLPDGRVEIVAEGEPNDVERLARWCKDGSTRAHVTGVESTTEAPEGLGSFRSL